MDQQGTDPASYPEVMARLQEIGLDDEPGLFAETVELFVTDSTAVLAQIEKAFAGGDALAIERGAHRLKGAALNLGVTSIAQPAKSLEDEARRHGFAGAPASLRELKDELAKVATFLRAAAVELSARR